MPSRLEEGEVSRRDLLEQGVKRSLFFLFVGGLLEEGYLALDSPLARFFLATPYQSKIIPATLQLTQSELQQADVYVPGASYAAGTGNPQAPIEIFSEKIARLGDWNPIIVAKAGSYLTDIPEQLSDEKVQAGLQNRGNRLILTDGGYNSVVLAMLDQAPDIAQRFESLKHDSRNVRALNELAEIFFLGLADVEKTFPDTLAMILTSVGAQKGYVYTWPPLELVKAVEHIPHKGDPNDSHFFLQIRGNPMTERIARQISILGSNMVIRCIEKVRERYGNQGNLIPIPLRRALTKNDYKARPDEHANEQGQESIADLQIDETEVERKRLRSELNAS